MLTRVNSPIGDWWEVIHFPHSFLVGSRLQNVWTMPLLSILRLQLSWERKRSKLQVPNQKASPNKKEKASFLLNLLELSNRAGLTPLHTNPQLSPPPIKEDHRFNKGLPRLPNLLHSKRTFDVSRVGGRLSQYAHQWHKSAWAFKVLRKGLGWAWNGALPQFKMFHQQSSPLLEEHLSMLLDLNAVEETKHLAFQGRLFSVPKKDTDRRRVILDLSTLNRHIVCPHFRMTTIQQVRDILPVNAWTISLDLREAYYHVPIAPHFRKFLGFRLNTRKFQFKALPFGLNIAPGVLTRLAKVVVGTLREKGIWAVAYLDDWLIWSDTRQGCIQAGQATQELLTKMGFLINIGKSRLEPAQKFQWLGLAWNTKKATISIPPKKKLEIKKALKSFLSATKATRRSLERILGSLQYASVVDPVGKTALKFLNHHMRQHASKPKRDWLLKIPPSLKGSLKRWLKSPSLDKNSPWRHPPASLDVHTDASMQGWGFHTSDGREMSGLWSPTFQKFHINILELVTAHLALRHLHLPKGTHLRLHSDNSTVVHCLNRKGSARSHILNSWVMTIQVFLERNNLFLSAFHVAGVSNVIADGLSRRTALASEWALDKKSFQWLCNLGIYPQVDLFATRENHQLPKFVSPILDPSAVGKDAFTLDWNLWQKIYLFPPWTQISKVLNILQTFKGQALLVAPRWPLQAWFPALQTRARKSFKIPNPILSQRVGKTTFYRTSEVDLHLHVWIL